MAIDLDCMLEFIAYLIVSYVFWELVSNRDSPAGRKREPWVREIRY